MQAAETAYTDAVMANSAGLQEELFTEIMSRLPANDSSTPQRSGEFWYYNYRRTGGSYRVYCRCALLERSYPVPCQRMDLSHCHVEVQQGNSMSFADSYEERYPSALYLTHTLHVPLSLLS